MLKKVAFWFTSFLFSGVFEYIWCMDLSTRAVPATPLRPSRWRWSPTSCGAAGDFLWKPWTGTLQSHVQKPSRARCVFMSYRLHFASHGPMSQCCDVQAAQFGYVWLWLQNLRRIQQLRHDGDCEDQLCGQEHWVSTSSKASNSLQVMVNKLRWVDHNGQRNGCLGPGRLDLWVPSLRFDPNWWCWQQLSMRSIDGEVIWCDVYNIV